MVTVHKHSCFYIKHNLYIIFQNVEDLEKLGLVLTCDILE